MLKISHFIFAKQLRENLIELSRYLPLIYAIIKKLKMTGLMFGSKNKKL